MIGYRHFHEQCNTSAVLTVALGEFGIQSFDPAIRGQELTLHGLIQRGPFLEGRGLLLAHALKYLFDRRVSWKIYHDQQRTALLRQRLEAAAPGFSFQLLEDLGAPSTRAFCVASDLPQGSLAVLVESRPAVTRLPLHLLLVSRQGEQFTIMNSDFGELITCSHQELASHLTVPVHFGAVSFAAGLFLHAGLVIRLDKPSASGAFEGV